MRKRRQGMHGKSGWRKKEKTVSINMATPSYFVGANIGGQKLVRFKGQSGTLILGKQRKNEEGPSKNLHDVKCRRQGTRFTGRKHI